ncbi:GDP-mannose 4,6-dehydratase [Patescibacteria group bacterium]|nr:GDP-mannose 4,6-dehydratase [Patescibacteria group bacterium]
MIDLNGKRVLVTGADGFMGSHLSEKLINLGAEVSIFLEGASANETVRRSLKNIESIRSKIKEILTGDIRGKDSINLIAKNKPQIIFHLAADAYVPNSFEHPIEVKETNLDGTLNVMHAAMNIDGLEQAVITSSSEIYGACAGLIDENHPMNPLSPYGASKVAADRFAYAYWNTYKLPVAIIRPFNTYGPRHVSNVIFKFIKLALEGKPITVHGSGGQTRDMTYVDDMIRAFIIMGTDRRAVGQAVNFGTGADTKIIDIAKKVLEYAGSNSEIIHLPERTSEVEKFLCDYSKAKELFGWEPTVSIDEGIKKNIEWAESVQPA